jgi:hypothetical protein
MHNIFDNFETTKYRETSLNRPFRKLALPEYRQIIKVPTEHFFAKEVLQKLLHY